MLIAPDPKAIPSRWTASLRAPADSLDRSRSSFPPTTEAPNLPDVVAELYGLPPRGPRRSSRSASHAHGQARRHDGGTRVGGDVASGLLLGESITLLRVGVRQTGGSSIGQNAIEIKDARPEKRRITTRDLPHPTALITHEIRTRSRDTELLGVVFPHVADAVRCSVPRNQR